jgi:hypothetical protein
MVSAGQSSVTMWDVMVSPDVRYCYLRLYGTPTPSNPTRTELMDSNPGVNSK